jgi:hypothetical protein
MSARCACSFVWYFRLATGVVGTTRPSVVSPHMRVGLRCGSGKLTKLESLKLDGNFAGTIPTEM